MYTLCFENKIYLTQLNSVKNNNLYKFIIKLIDI